MARRGKIWYDTIRFHVKHNLTKPSMIPYRKISNNLIKRASNWYPKIDIETGLKKTIYWYINSVIKN